MKRQNFDFEVAGDFFNEMNYYTIQFRIIWRKYGHVDFTYSLAIGFVYDHEITQHMHCVMLLWYLYEYWDSNG